MIRYPAVEGTFYASSQEEIFHFFSHLERISPFKPEIFEDERILGAVLPHAGHQYSAYQTVPFFQFLVDKKFTPESIIILHPNHTGFGPQISLPPHVSWKNCIGSIDIDQELARLLPYPMDNFAHENEHSAEVLLPYLQYFFPENSFKILPICMKRVSLEESAKLAKDIFIAEKKTGKNILLLASSDFSHFLSPEEGFQKDQLFLDHLFMRDRKSAEQVVIENNLSICGYLPILTLMAYASNKDPGYGIQLMERGHSGEVSPSQKVVDYISLLFHFNKQVNET